MSDLVKLDIDDSYLMNNEKIIYYTEKDGFFYKILKKLLNKPRTGYVLTDKRLIEFDIQNNITSARYVNIDEIKFIGQRKSGLNENKIIVKDENNKRIEVWVDDKEKIRDIKENIRNIKEN